MGETSQRQVRRSQYLVLSREGCDIRTEDGTFKTATMSTVMLTPEEAAPYIHDGKIIPWKEDSDEA